MSTPSPFDHSSQSKTLIKTSIAPSSLLDCCPHCGKSLEVNNTHTDEAS